MQQSAPAIINELVDVLRRKFDLTPVEISQAREIIGAGARTVQPSVTLEVIKEDPPDNRILERAVSAGSDYIVGRMIAKASFQGESSR